MVINCYQVPCQKLKTIIVTRNKSTRHTKLAFYSFLERHLHNVKQAFSKVLELELYLNHLHYIHLILVQILHWNTSYTFVTSFYITKWILFTKYGKILASRAHLKNLQENHRKGKYLRKKGIKKYFIYPNLSMPSHVRQSNRLQNRIFSHFLLVTSTKNLMSDSQFGKFNKITRIRVKGK